jgi:hypothetical protein
MKLLFPLIGYFCVATVISGVLGFGYLRHSGKLDDERMFRIVALMHGIDLEKIGQDDDQQQMSEVPPEELSYDQQLDQLQVATLHFDVKQKTLSESLSDFDSQLKRLTTQTNRYAMLRKDVETWLDMQSKLVTDEALLTVVRQFEGMSPKKQVKPELIQMVKDGRVEEVITILGSMANRVRRDVLKSFDSPDDLDMLYQIHSKILDGEPAKPYIESQLKALDQLKKQDGT